jgi:hypothetical protein
MRVRKMAPLVELGNNMTPQKILLISGILACGGCSYVPNYDVPIDSDGRPTVATIVWRIECELTEMVADIDDRRDVKSFNNKFLREGNYDVEATLSVEVDDSGGLAPALTSIVPYGAAATSLGLGATANLSASRDQTFTENLRFNMTKIYAKWQNNKGRQVCPPQDTPLSGDLGLSNLVAMAADSEPAGLNHIDTSQNLAGKGAFGGSVQFLITKGVSAAGPTWMLTHFKGPGGLASFSRVNTDKLTIAFAHHESSAGAPASSTNKEAAALVQTIIFNSISTKISIQNAPH